MVLIFDSRARGLSEEEEENGSSSLEGVGCVVPKPQPSLEKKFVDAPNRCEKRR
jgi:hypothetical protein